MPSSTAARMALVLAVLLLLQAVLPGRVPAVPESRPSLAARRAAWQRGNLLPDGGFELGGRGWRLAEARVTDGHPHEGLHALRLAAHAGGRAEASVRVPVLPGLYSLSAALRLGATPPPEGGTMADRLRVRVEWLDEEGNVLGNGAGDRPYPLAFLKRAGGTDPAWQRAVFVSSYEDPEGDEAPPGAAHARIRFTLNGPGTVGIDDVRFGYSRRNLTLAERLAPYRGLDDEALGRVVPTPVDIREHGPARPVRRFCLRPPAGTPPGLGNRVSALEGRLGDLGAMLVRLKGKEDGTAGCDATLRLARADEDVPGEMAATAARARRLGPEGYALRSTGAAGGELLIDAVGADADGVVYAVETVRQLLRPGPAGGAAMRSVEGTDRPAFRGRSVSGWEPGKAGMRMILDASEWMVGLKLNRLYLNYTLRTPRWWEPPATYRALLLGLGERARQTRLYQLGVLLNPYAQRSRPEITDTFQISRKQDVEILLSEIDHSLEAGARLVMLCLDDFLPATEENRFAYRLDDPDDLARFGSLSEAHLWLIERVRRRVRASKGARLLIVPPWYNENFRVRGGDEAEAYLSALGRGLPPDVGLVWTGPTVRSRIVDGASRAGFSASVGGRPLLLWDNSVWELELSPHYAGSPRRADRASLFEPFHIEIEIEDLPASSFQGEFYFNGSTGGRFLAKAMTLADFLWNPEDYDPERSMWRAMVRRWGRRTAGLLVDWDAAYWRERLWINRLAASRGRPEAALNARLEQARSDSAARWRRLRAALDGRDDALVQELEAWVEEQSARTAEAEGLRPAAP